MIYRLISVEDKTCFFEFRQTELSEAYIIGDLYSVEGWTADFTIPTDYSFVTSAYIKWDGCSHFNFYGEDYSKGDKEKNSYYHICGKGSYYQFMLGIAFMYALGARYIEKADLDEFDDNEILRFIAGCEIIEIEEEE